MSRRFPSRNSTSRPSTPRSAAEFIDTHIWAVREGLRGATAYDLFDGYCQRLVVHGVPLWRAHAAMETLHPQWSGYGYTWRRDLNAIQPEQYRAQRRRCAGLAEQPALRPDPSGAGGRGQSLDAPAPRRRTRSSAIFPCWMNSSPQGATDYLAQLFTFGESGDPSHGTGVVYSFATDRPGGFADDDTDAVAGDACRRCRWR